MGVFGQRYPQNITTEQGFVSVEALKVKPEADHKDGDRVGVDGLPHVGAVVWPGQSYYGTVDRMTGGYLPVNIHAHVHTYISA